MSKILEFSDGDPGLEDKWLLGVGKCKELRAIAALLVVARS